MFRHFTDLFARKENELIESLRRRSLPFLWQGGKEEPVRKKRKKKFQIAAVALAIVAAVVATAVLGMNLAVDSLLNQT